MPAAKTPAQKATQDASTGTLGEWLPVEEFSIDGRGDGGEAHIPVFAGAFSFAANTTRSGR